MSSAGSEGTTRLSELQSCIAPVGSGILDRFLRPSIYAEIARSWEEPARHSFRGKILSCRHEASFCRLHGGGLRGKLACLPGEWGLDQAPAVESWKAEKPPADFIGHPVSYPGKDRLVEEKGLQGGSLAARS